MDNKESTTTHREPIRTPWWRSLLSSVSLLMNIVVVLLLAGALLSPHVSPNTVRLFAFLGLGFPALLLLELAFTLYGFLRKRLGRSIFNVLVLALAFPLTMQYMPLHRNTVDTERQSDDDVKLLTFNVCAFRAQQAVSNKLHPTLAYIQSVDADIVALQEATLSKSSKRGMTLQEIKKCFSNRHIRTIHSNNGKRGSRLLVISKYPIKRVRPIELDRSYNGSVVFTIDVNGKDLQLYNVHLESFKLRRRDKSKYVDLVKQGEALQLTKEVERKFSPSFRTRARQADIIYRDIHKQESPYVVVCGDFNDTPISYTHQRIATGMTDSFVHSGRGLGFTYQKSLLGVRIDHIIHSKMIESYGSHVDSQTEVSDHQPVITYLHLKDQGQ